MTEERTTSGNREAAVAETAACAEGRQEAATDHADETGGEAVTDSDYESTLEPGRKALLTALVGNPDVNLAAAAVNISRTTAFRWMREPGFREKLTQERNETLADALSTVKSHAMQAAAQLAGMLTATDERLRRQVCNDILGHSLKVRELEDLEKRLVSLEKKLAPKR